MQDRKESCARECAPHSRWRLYSGSERRNCPNCFVARRVSGGLFALYYEEGFQPKKCCSREWPVDLHGPWLLAVHLHRQWHCFLEILRIRMDSLVRRLTSAYSL